MGLCQSKRSSSNAVALSRNNQTSDTKPIPPPSTGTISASRGGEIRRGGEGITMSVPHASDSSRVVSSGQSISQHGYSSGASTPGSGDDNSLGDAAEIMNGSSHTNPKTLMNSSSVLGLDRMIDERKFEGDLVNNIVHMEVPFGKPIEEVYDGVHDGPLLGSGVSGLVRQVTHKQTGHKYAVKCLDLGLVETEEGLTRLREEIAIMCQLDHPNIVRLEEVYESHDEIYLVQELCFGGELFDRLDEQPDYHYTEAECARLVKQMLCSIRYIHSKGIIHRDLKLENFLFSTTNPDSELKMIDFGLSKHFKFGEVQHEAVGTPYTVAPEVIRGSYDERCDVWAMGVITYLLLSGDPPFGGCGGPETLMQVRSNILSGHFEFTPYDIWEHVSSQAKDFIRTLLVTDPNSRPTAKECQKNPWIKEWSKKNEKEEDNMLSLNVVNALVNFKEYSDMRKLLCEVLSFTLLPDQIADLRKEFEKLDTDGSGEISLQGLKQVLMQNAGAGSLGALTETEVEDIFNAMRVRKTETKIHWHEFIAAGLSQCQVDDRNLKLAFDRLDSNHKGYITFDNVMDLMGRDALGNEDEMRAMWGDAMRDSQAHAHITYEDFLLLMKGQTKEGPIQPRLSANIKLKNEFIQSIGTGNLDVLIEDDAFEDDESKDASPKSPAGMIPILNQLPNIENDIDDISDGPVTIDSDEDLTISKKADSKMLASIKRPNLTPPQSPIRGISDYVTPTAENRFQTNEITKAIIDVPLPLLPETDFSRRRSKSVDDGEDLAGTNSDTLPFVPTCSLRAINVPEHTHDAEMEKVIKDETKTPLVVNRKLYRAHRKMRLAVIEASKNFDDKQIKRTAAEMQRVGGAGLVMRHGFRKEISTETIRKFMKDKQKEQEALVAKANRRGGRGRGSRMKTISDMSGMLLPSEGKGIESPVVEKRPDIPLQQQELQVHETTKPKPTIPGNFINVSYDPFSFFGMMVGLKKEDIGDDIQQHSDGHAPENIKKSKMKQSQSDGDLNNKVAEASVTP